MSRQPNVAAYLDCAGRHHARIVAADGDILFVSSEGYDSKDDLIVARELARRALNDEIANDPAYRARVETLMAQRAPKSTPLPPGSSSAQGIPPHSKLAEALSRRAGIGAPTLDRLFGLGPDKDGQS